MTFMTATTNAKKSRQNKMCFSLIVEKVLAFASRPNMVREVKNLSPNLKRILWLCFTLLNVLICKLRSFLSLDCKQFHQKVYSNSLYIVDITYNFF